MGRVFPGEMPRSEARKAPAPAASTGTGANGATNGSTRPEAIAASAVVRPVPGGEHKGMLKLVSFSQPENGTTTRNADQTLTYRPKPGFTGKDSFEYTLRDEVGEEFSATVTLAVSLDAPARKPAPRHTPVLRALDRLPKSVSGQRGNRQASPTPPSMPLTAGE